MLTIWKWQNDKMPLVGIRLELTLLFNRKYFHLYSPCQCPLCLVWSYVCTFYSLPDTCLCTWFPTWSPPTVSQGAADSQRTPSPARLGPAVDFVRQSSTYRPTCQDASSALTGQTREKAWTGWRQIFPKWLSHIAGSYLIFPCRN